MSFLADKRKKKRVIRISTITIVLVVIVVSCYIYLSDYYHADSKAITEFTSAINNVSTQTLADNTIVYTPDNAKTGFIFYPGGKVEYTAYAPLMKTCASKGILCVLVEMPFNLAVFDINAAAGIQEMYPEIESWYIGGHSLGGSMAASYLSDNTDAFDGLVLLGSYSTANLSTTFLEVLSVYGSEDKVLNREKYDENKSNLPNNFTEIVIDGGCHAYFGMYGPQDGDGIPTISNIEQINFTAETIIEFIEGLPF